MRRNAVISSSPGPARLEGLHRKSPSDDQKSRLLLVSAVGDMIYPSYSPVVSLSVYSNTAVWHICVVRLSDLYGA